MEAIPYLVRGVLFPLAIGGMLAYLYSDLHVYIRRPWSSFHLRRVDKLLEEYRMTSQYSVDTLFLVKHIVYHLASLLGQLAMLILVTALHLNSLFGDLLGFILYGFITTSCLVQVNIIHNIINNANDFHTYRQKTIAALNRLGVNPQVLEKGVFEKQGR